MHGLGLGVPGSAPFGRGPGMTTEVVYDAVGLSYSLSTCACPVSAGRERPASAHAAKSVLASRQAIVIGPTPPGTGVMAPATLHTAAKATSPTMLDLPLSSVTRLMPTSITVAPGLTQLRRTISA